MKTFEVSGKDYPLKELKKWIKALRSGTYKQTVGFLQGETGFCCLGVACKELIPKAGLSLELGKLYGKTPECQPFAPFWLNQIDDDFYNKTGSYLVTINDDWELKNKTFNYVADLLEAVYIHGIYDLDPDYEIDTDEYFVRKNLGVKP